MNNLADMIWIEQRKAIRSRMPLWTALGSLFMPLGIAFLIFVSKNPEISQKLGLVSAKANLIAYSATDWPTYLGLSGQIIGCRWILFVRPGYQLDIWPRICRWHPERHAGRAGATLQHPPGEIHRSGSLVGGADHGHVHGQPGDGCADPAPGKLEQR